MADEARHIDSFLEMMAAERGAAGNTVAAYRRDAEDLLEFLSTLPDWPTLKVVEDRHLRLYLSSLVRPGPLGPYDVAAHRGRSASSSDSWSRKVCAATTRSRGSTRRGGAALYRPC